MYLEIFLADFAVFRLFLGISRDFTEIPEFRGFATARNIRSPVQCSAPSCDRFGHQGQKKICQLNFIAVAKVAKLITCTI